MVGLGVLAAFLIVVALEALLYGLRFQLSPHVWTGVYQRFPIASPLILVAISVCVMTVVAVVFLSKRRRPRRTEESGGHG
jgi:hypothetical protein